MTNNIDREPGKFFVVSVAGNNAESVGGLSLDEAIDGANQSESILRGRFSNYTVHIINESLKIIDPNKGFSSDESSIKK